ncbi:hypothetical protein [uncultured Alistipes sp.]|uniref:hypothetical protein n=1 Tax=uncultured Alistipes sp. TaxID=538949 RepID=UPI00260B5528|nr:hypothetical protein [uncultured Alistipes sp.]
MKRILFLTILFTGMTLAATAGSPATEAPATESPAPTPEAAPADTLRYRSERARKRKELRTDLERQRKAADVEERFLPTRKRIDREIDKIKFAYKGEVMMGLTASYGTLSSDDTDFMVIIDKIDASGTIATVKPFFGYFYRDNKCVGMRFGYTHLDGKLDNMNIDLGENNDINMAVPYLNAASDSYSFGIFHRSYAGLDPRGRFGLFAEFELSASTGNTRFSYESGGAVKKVFSDNTQLKLSFNPGAAVYIFPNVCATLSFGLGGIQYTSVTQKDAEGNKVGSRQASKMKFKLNIAAINIGMTIHLWDKKKE